jgi:hypothetical protein
MPIPAFASACFFSVNNGATVQNRLSAQDERARPLPSGVTNIFRFDETQTNNHGLITQWSANSAAFSMVGSQVLVSGDPASFDPPSIAWTALEQAQSLYSKMVDTNDAFTREDMANMMAMTFRALGYL